jgi:rubrerythrin
MSVEELNHNISAERKAVSDYERFYRNLARAGKTTDARLVLHILNEERSHLRDLLARRRYF